MVSFVSVPYSVLKSSLTEKAILTWFSGSSLKISRLEELSSIGLFVLYNKTLKYAIALLISLLLMLQITACPSFEHFWTMNLIIIVVYTFYILSQLR